MGELTIGAVAAKTGLSASAIRYYESVGLVPKPARKHGRRVYDETAIKSLAFVVVAKDGGFSIKEIKQLVRQLTNKRSPSESWKRAAQAKLAELEEQSRRIEHMRQVLKMGMGCACPSLDECTDLPLP